MRSEFLPVEIIDHTADLGIIARGDNLDSLFRNAALGMTRLMVSGACRSDGKAEPVTIEGCDLTDLFVKWLGEILYLLQGEYRIATDARVISVSTDRLEAELDLVDFDPVHHRIDRDIKAVTYHQSMVSNNGVQWLGRVIFDL
jgi:SHS2 domain-containing protein